MRDLFDETLSTFLLSISKVLLSKVKDEVYLRSGDTLCVSAKSLLGCKLAAIEWDNLVCQCDTDIYTAIQKFTEE